MTGLSALPWLYGWSPGHGADSEPDGYGVSVPAGSLIVLQVHYNSLAGKSPVTATFSTWSEAQATSTRTPLYPRQYVAAPDLPCVAPYNNVKKYPLCDHAASLNDLAKRFGASAKSFTQLIEGFCNRGQFPTSSSASNATSATCSYRVPDTVTIHSVWPHMHLLGKTFNLVVCHQDPTCAPANTQTLTVVGSYNFDLQVGYPINPPVVVTPGDYVKVTCTYDPHLRKLNPQTKNLAPRYVTWGDGSSDEMCLGTLIYSNGANT